MSVTLRDAQHLSWKTFKKFENINREHSDKVESGLNLAKAVSEIAHILEQKGESEEAEIRDLVGRKLSEMLFDCFVIAERKGVSLEDSFLQAVDELILGFVS